MTNSDSTFHKFQRQVSLCNRTTNKSLVFLLHFGILCLFSIRTAESSPVLGLQSIKSSRTDFVESSAVDRSHRSGFLKRLIRSVSECCDCYLPGEERHDTQKSCVQIMDLVHGLQWGIDTRNIGDEVMAYNDNKVYKWILFKRENISMFALPSSIPGYYHFARKYRSNHVRLSRAEPFHEIQLHSNDSRYFVTGRDSRSRSSYIMHVESRLYVTVERHFHHRLIALTGDIQNIDHDWYIEPADFFL